MSGFWGAADPDGLVALAGTIAKDPSGYRMVTITHRGTGSIISKMRQRPVHESSKLRLMACPRFGKGLLELAPRCGQSHAHCVGGGLQAMAIRNGHRYLCFTIGQVEGSP